MKPLLAAAVAIVLATTILGPPVASAQDDAGFADPTVVAASAVPVQAVAPGDVLKMIDDQRADIALVDTQPADGYAEQHIPGAINYPWVMQIKNFPIPLPRNKVLIFYGACPNDTSDMVKKLAEFGYFNSKVMDGGIESWIALKYPITGTSHGGQATPDISQLTAKPPKNGKAASH
jgi:rhodanese-related sulfurtransferase